MADETRSTQASSSKARACLNCSIIKSMSYFKQNGCPNCPFLMVNHDRNVHYTTSASFRGLIALVNPRSSWVAKWQRISNYEPGTYAMTVEGVLSNSFIDKIEREGRIYVNRSSSFSLN